MRVKETLKADTSAKLDRMIEDYNEKYPYVYGVIVASRFEEDGKHVAIMSRYTTAD